MVSLHDNHLSALQRKRVRLPNKQLYLRNGMYRSVSLLYVPRQHPEVEKVPQDDCLVWADVLVPCSKSRPALLAVEREVNVAADSYDRRCLGLAWHGRRVYAAGSYLASKCLLDKKIARARPSGVCDRRRARSLLSGLLWILFLSTSPVHGFFSGAQAPPSSQRPVFFV